VTRGHRRAFRSSHTVIGGTVPVSQPPPTTTGKIRICALNRGIVDAPHSGERDLARDVELFMSFSR
jgi:hypothetical protein